MVEYNNILQVIDEYVEKCSQHLTLNKAVLSQFNKFHEQVCIKRSLKKEKALICDNKGNNIFTKNGSKHSVSIQENTIDDLYEKYGELHLTHNHPSIGKPMAECLSKSDVISLFQERQEYDIHEGYGDYYFPFKSISCESPNGSRMTLVRADNFKRENQYDVVNLGGDLQDAYNDYIKRTHRTSNKIFDDKDMMKDVPSDDIFNFAYTETIKREGRFEDSEEFKKIQSDFKKLDCRLEITYPYDYPY